MFRVRREDLKPGEILCSYCTAKCCRYFALPIDTPTAWDDFDHLRWYVMHGRSAVFVDDETWYLMVYGDCENLQDNNQCGIYDNRPSICRKYSTNDCEYDDADSCYDRFFESADQIWEYAEAVLPRKRPKRNRTGGRSVVQLPVLSACREGSPL